MKETISSEVHELEFLCGCQVTDYTDRTMCTLVTVQAWLKMHISLRSTINLSNLSKTLGHFFTYTRLSNKLFQFYIAHIQLGSIFAY
jgi:hypothetical protein